MQLIKLLVLFSCIVFLVAKCRAERSLELKPVTRITPVLSRDVSASSPPYDQDGQAVGKVDELCEDERKRICNNAKEIIERDFQSSQIDQTTELQEYVVEVGQQEGEILHEIVKAFECSTAPKTLIQVHTFNGRPDYYSKLSVIFKDSDSGPKLEDIMGYQIQLVQNVTEAFSDELKSRNPKELVQSRSFLDTDELTETQCLQICQKAVYILSDKNISFREAAITRCTQNKYYSLVSREEDADSGGREVVQAFECPTQPELYVHMDDEMDMWFILKEDDLRLDFDIMGYQLKAVMDISAVPRKLVRQMLREDPRTMVRAASKIDFNKLSPDNLLEFCRKTIRVVFGTRVTVLENIGEIALSEFYTLRQSRDQTKKPIVMQAIVCPTDSFAFGNAYIHVNRRGGNRENNVLVLVEPNDDSTRLSAWTDE